MSNSFPPHIEDILQRYTVPALPSGFADRVVAAVAQQSSGRGQAKFLPWRRDRGLDQNSPWKRGRFIASSVAGIALLSTAAAAALSLANIPVRIPIVSDFVERVLPQKTVSAAFAKNIDAVVPASAKIPDSAPSIDSLDSEIGTENQARWRELGRSEKIALIKSRVRKNEARIQRRRAANDLSPLTKPQLRHRRAAIRRAVKNGTISRPAIRRSFRQDTIRRKAENAVVRGDHSVQPIAPKPSRPALVAKPSQLSEITAERVQPKPIEELPGADATDNNIMAAALPTIRDEIVAIPKVEAAPAIPDATLRTRLRDRLPARAKAKLRDAKPAERRRILRSLRSKRQNSKAMRDARKRLRDIRRNAK